ncbi:MAG: hypothetical protein ACYC6M_03655 [Terriglobales bacterium]
MNLPSMPLPFALGRFGMPSSLVAAGRPRPTGAPAGAPTGALAGMRAGAAPALPLPADPLAPPPAPRSLLPALAPPQMNDDGGAPRGVVDAPRVPPTTDGADGPQTLDQRRQRAQHFGAYPGLAGRIRGISNLY